MDEKIVECAIESAMENYGRDDYDYIKGLCRAVIEAYEKALIEAGHVIIIEEPTTAQTEAGRDTSQTGAIMSFTYKSLDEYPGLARTIMPPKRRVNDGQGN